MVPDVRRRWSIVVHSIVLRMRNFSEPPVATNIHDIHHRKVSEANYKSVAMDAMVVCSREVKTFEFRERLWHESPELDYRHFDCIEEVQKELKQIGGWNLKLCTDWTDLNVEKELLEKYVSWARSEHYAPFNEDGGFDLELAYELSVDLAEMDDQEEDGHNLDPGYYNRNQKAIKRATRVNK